MKRFELYVWLTTFFRPIDEYSPSDRLWLLPWHVPPIPTPAPHFDRGTRSANNGTTSHCP